MMIRTLMQVNTPPKLPNRKLTSHSNSIISCTCKQAEMIKLTFDNPIYKTMIVSKLIFCGRIIRENNGKSVIGSPLKIIQLKDSTGTITIQSFQSPFWKDIPSLINDQAYIKIAVNAKPSGMVYKRQIKYTVISYRKLQNFNQLTNHLLHVMSDELKILN